MATTHPLEREITAWRTAWQRTITATNDLEEEHWATTPPHGGWTIQQVIQHLLLTEELSMRYVAKKTLAPDRLLPGSPLTTFRSWGLWLYLNSPLKYRAPKIVDTPNFPEETVAQTKARLTQWQQQGSKDLLTMAPELVKKQIYRHPFAGRLSGPQMIRFWRWHLVHHAKQIQRIRQAIQ